MNRIARLAPLFAAAALSFACRADQTSYHFAGPVAMMYDLPVGETPGWTGRTWINTEVSLANIWNHQASFTDTRNGNVYTLFADYEQEAVIADMGLALTHSLAASVEVPYLNHNGGFTDDMIDQYHDLLGCDRFMRNVSPKFGNHFQIQTNGVNMLSTEHAEGVGNVKAKLKWWIWHWNSPTPGACDCGLAVSGQAKFPTQTRLHGLTSGSNDYSGLIHFGVPLNHASGMWATAAFTKLGPNDTFAGWPMRYWLQMYELSFDLAAGAHFGVLLQGRAESPLFNKQYLSFNYTTTTPQDQLEERVASGWNALVEWRGSEDIGVRWRWGKGQEFRAMFVEDWAIGNQDQSGDGFYINDAPDFEIVTQLHLSF